MFALRFLLAALHLFSHCSDLLDLSTWGSTCRRHGCKNPPNVLHEAPSAREYIGYILMVVWCVDRLRFAPSNLFTVRNGSCIFFSRALPWVVQSSNSLEDSNWSAARIMCSLYSMYSHMCQDLAEEMRGLRGWQSKRSRVWIDADGDNRVFFTRAHLLQTLHLFFVFCFLSPSPRRSKETSRMDMYANLGDDEAIVWVWIGSVMMSIKDEAF